MLLDLVKKSRSYRSYNQNRAISEAELLSLAEHARLTASGNNRQLLRLRLVSTAEEMGRLLPCLKWAAALPDWHLPPEGHAPTAAIVLCHDAGYTVDANGRITRFDRENFTPIHELPLSKILALEFDQPFEGKTLHPCTLDSMLAAPNTIDFSGLELK